jgi:hypothetical protein
MKATELRGEKRGNAQKRPARGRAKQDAAARMSLDYDGVR